MKIIEDKPPKFAYRVREACGEELEWARAQAAFLPATPERRIPNWLAAIMVSRPAEWLFQKWLKHRSIEIDLAILRADIKKLEDELNGR